MLWPRNVSKTKTKQKNNTKIIKRDQFYVIHSVYNTMSKPNDEKKFKQILLIRNYYIIIFFFTSKLKILILFMFDFKVSEQVSHPVEHVKHRE